MKIKTRIERETTITFNDQEDYALVGSASPVMRRKLEKRKLEVHRNDGEWITYKVPKKLIQIRKPYQVASQSRKRPFPVQKPHKIKASEEASII